MDEIKQFANEVIPKPRFIFDNYKTTLNNSPATPSEEALSSDGTDSEAHQPS